jgi:phage anti-repressor protein
MKALINIKQDGDRQLVDARELHGFLENSYRFSDWIKKRVKQYGFEQGKDFVIFESNFFDAKRTGRGGHNAKDYALTLNMAKELAMVENNEKGREARRYFIAVEEAYKKGQSLEASKVPDIALIGRKYRRNELHGLTG